MNKRILPIIIFVFVLGVAYYFSVGGMQKTNVVSQQKNIQTKKVVVENKMQKEQDSTSSTITQDGNLSKDKNDKKTDVSEIENLSEEFGNELMNMDKDMNDLDEMEEDNSSNDIDSDLSEI